MNVKKRRSETLAPALCAALTLALVALAFYLPARLSRWNDRLLLDEPHITRQEAEREGFAESMQLSIGEKLLMIQGGSTSVLRLEEETVSVRFGITDGSATVYTGTENPYIYLRDLDGSTAAVEDVVYDAEAEAEKWRQRLTDIQDELHTLYQLGAIPQLWSSAETVDIASGGQVLYMNSDTQVSFQVYYATLSRAPYTINVAVDVQSGRILAFTLTWPVGSDVNLVWGLRGMSNFGGGWRDYWGLDSVDSNWNSPHIRSILDQQETILTKDGSYNANADIAFSYDGQSIYIPISSTAVLSRTCQLSWNSRMESFGQYLVTGPSY